MQARPQKPFPYKYYYFPVLFLLLLGLLDTVYLAFTHYRNYTDIMYSSFCAITKAINCDTVAQSPWSILFGIPVALWGVFGYLIYGVLLVAVRKNTPKRMVLWNLLFLLGVLYSGTAVYFGYISASKIHSYCILCVLSYAISFLLLLYAWIIRRRFDCGSILQGSQRAFYFAAQDRFVKITGLSIICFFVGIKLSLPHYWIYQFPELSSSTVSTGLTDDGHPWVGAIEPVVTIEEYSDYQCFQCSKMHFMLRRIVEENPDKIRLVHCHFPMDHEFNEIVVPEPFHVGSGKLALLAIYAASQGKFWEMNDVLFQLGQSKEPFNTKTLAQQTGFTAGELSASIHNPNIRLSLRNDIRQGMMLGITGTPAFVINNHVYSGVIPPDLLKDVL